MKLLPKLGHLLSQALNALAFDGDPDESLSARAHRERWPKGEGRIDRWLGAGHCAAVWRSQMARIHSRLRASQSPPQ
jgi:hypothetical protein